jgi:glycosyltransferase involved in cell wall biosynthesis
LKVLFDAQIFRQQRYGGISRYFCELATRLEAMPDVTARIVAPHHRNEYLAGVPAPVVQGWHSRHWKRLGKVSRFAGRLLERRTTARMQPDVIHETYFWGSPLRHPGALKVLTVYDMIHERFPDRFDAHDHTAEAKRGAVARADHVICISHSTKRDLLALLPVPEAKVSVIHLASSLVPPAETAPASGAPYLLYVGDRWTYKNFLQLVEAVGASPMLRDFRIVCFGGGALDAAEWAAIDAAGIARERVEQLHGDDTLLARLYAGAFCFVYPSLYEGFGIPPLEAMQCNCPVVCSNTSSIPEVVGDAAETFDPGEPGALRAALERLVSSETRREQLRALGHERQRQFSWDACTNETLALYRRLLAGHKTNQELVHA